MRVSVSMLYECGFTCAILTGSWHLVCSVDCEHVARVVHIGGRHQMLVNMSLIMRSELYRKVLN